MIVHRFLKYGGLHCPPTSCLMMTSHHVHELMEQDKLDSSLVSGPAEAELLFIELRTNGNGGHSQLQKASQNFGQLLRVRIDGHLVNPHPIDLERDAANCQVDNILEKSEQRFGN